MLHHLLPKVFIDLFLICTESKAAWMEVEERRVSKVNAATTG
jgi:hypothetical protein